MQKNEPLAKLMLLMNEFCDVLGLFFFYSLKLAWLIGLLSIPITVVSNTLADTDIYKYVYSCKDLRDLRDNGKQSDMWNKKKRQ